MSTKAIIRPGYRWRLAAIGGVLLAAGLWFLYDGVVGYPDQKLKYDTYMQITEEHPETWQQPWQEAADAHGWSTDIPKPRTDSDIMQQYIYAGLLLPAGVVLLVVFQRMNGRWIAADEQGLSTSWGKTASWDAIESVDKSRWKNKGIAVVRIRAQQGGKPGKITLDDWKYDREPTAAILAQVESRLGISEDDADAKTSAAADADTNADEPADAKA